VIDDVPLIERSRRGDSAAFGGLVRKYQDRLFNTVVHVAGSREEAEDVVQEAFVQAFLKLASFHGDSAFYTWLYRIAFNVAVSRRRRKRNEVSLDAAREDAGREPADDLEHPGEQMLRQERANLVHAALAVLSEEHRTILVLREMEGFEYEQISDILDLPTGTVRSRLHRARLQLREQLKTVLQDSPA
jgi:RNA polymerase sigma-70 factor (ECF subfamily)